MNNTKQNINWIECEIGEVAEVIGGGTPKSDDTSNFAEPGTEIAWLTPADLSGYKNQYISHGARDLSTKGYQSSSAKIMPSGALLFSSRAPIGYVAIAQNEISTNQGFKSFVFPLEIDSKFAFHFLKSIREIAESRGTGTTFKELSGANAKKLPFVIAPIAEQQHIAAKLDELLTQVDSIKARLETIPKILKRFRQSVLTSAVSAKLTENWRKENSSSNPLKTWPSAKEIGAAFDIPSEWKGVSLGSVSDRVSVGHVGKTTEYYTDEVNGIPFFRSQNVRSGSVSLEGLNYITEDFHNSLKKSQLKPGDLLVVRVGANRGDACILPNLFERLNCANIVFARPKNGLSAYLNIYFQSPTARDLLIGKTVGGAQGVINTKSVAETFLALPPLEEQTEIVRRVEQLFSYADQIEQRVKDAQARVNHLNQSILAKAFRGELTADWRLKNLDLISGENSAEALLKRIQLGRIADNSKSKIIKVKKKSSDSMTPKQIIPVYKALRAAGRALSGQELLASAGYPDDASTQQLEQFFLDIQQQLELKTITRNRLENSDQDWFEVNMTEG